MEEVLFKGTHDQISIEWGQASARGSSLDLKVIFGIEDVVMGEDGSCGMGKYQSMDNTKV